MLYYTSILFPYCIHSIVRQLGSLLFSAKIHMHTIYISIVAKDFEKNFQCYNFRLGVSISIFMQYDWLFVEFLFKYASFKYAGQNMSLGLHGKKRSGCCNTDENRIEQLSTILNNIVTPIQA